LKSLAHPNWPYVGTPHEWRGFAERAEPANKGRHYAPVTPIEPKHVERLKELKAAEPAKGGHVRWLTYKDGEYIDWSYYQKLNLGPELP
jgi:hypothetical protein